jgi:hypothetical protein
VYLVSYTAFGLPAVIAGLLVPVLGLVSVVNCYAALVMLVSALALVLQLLLTRIRSIEEIADAADALEEPA